MSKFLVLLCASLVLALGLVASGCGGGDGDDEGAGGGVGGAEKPAKKEPETPGGGAKAASVTMKDIQFKPEDVAVTKGSVVTWTNDDSAPHDVTKTSGPGPKFSSGKGDMQQGDTFKQTFKTPGKINYVCTVHPGMEGTVTVK